MKIDTLFSAPFVLLGTTLLARILTQGFEQGLFSTAMEYGLKGLKAGATLLPQYRRL